MTKDWPVKAQTLLFMSAPIDDGVVWKPGGLGQVPKCRRGNERCRCRPRGYSRPKLKEEKSFQHPSRKKKVFKSERDCTCPDRFGLYSHT
jgi:hypothetical protein